MDLKKLNKDQAAVIAAYTGILIGEFSAMHEYSEEKLGRPIWMHQFPGVRDKLREACKEDFLSMSPEPGGAGGLISVELTEGELDVVQGMLEGLNDHFVLEQKDKPTLQQVEIESAEFIKTALEKFMKASYEHYQSEEVPV